MKTQTPATPTTNVRQLRSSLPMGTDRTKVPIQNSWKLSKDSSLAVKTRAYWLVSSARHSPTLEIQLTRAGALDVLNALVTCTSQESNPRLSTAVADLKEVIVLFD